MPIYEYECLNCKIQFEKLQKMSDLPITNCPECSNGKVKKLISATSFRLKGQGWYETDFKSSKEKKRNLAESTESIKPTEPVKSVEPKVSTEAK